jgi:transglutaminase-like putative cysteine protease
MRYRVRHETIYSYGSDVVHSHQLLHLVPRPSRYQQCLEHSITISPDTFTRRDETDAFGNLVTRVEFEHPHRRLDVSTEMEVEVHALPAVSPSDTVPWEKVRESLSYNGEWPAREALEACRFRHESPYVRVKQLFTDYAADCFSPGRPVLECGVALMQKLHRELKYAPGETDIATPLAEVLRTRRGVCQDFAHLMIACLRARGLAARYVSGYIRLRAAVPPPPAPDHGDSHPLQITQMGTPSPEPQLDWVGAGASHAWVSLYSPPFGWLELDPTNNVHVGTDHLAIAWGRDFGDVSPLRGVILGGGSHSLTVSVTVEPLTEKPVVHGQSQSQSKS